MRSGGPPAERRGGISEVPPAENRAGRGVVPMRYEYPSTVSLLLSTQDTAGVSSIWSYQCCGAISLILAYF